MQNARKPRVRQKNQRSHKNRKNQKNRGRPPRPRSEPYAAEPRDPRPHDPRDSRDPHNSRDPYEQEPHPRPAVSGTARSHFPSRPAARLAGLSDRAGRAADRFLPHTTAERALDLTLGIFLLILTAPAVAVTALALTARKTPGGAWDRRPRTGLGGRVFELRTLRARRLRLDLYSRLPHVVRGELSLVGPAPLAPGDPRATGPGARRWRQEVRPGLTGLAQVRARSGMPWDDPALLDQHYAEHHGVVLDLAILAEAVRGPLRSGLRKVRRTKAHLSDTDHRPPGCSGVD